MVECGSLRTVVRGAHKVSVSLVAVTTFLVSTAFADVSNLDHDEILNDVWNSELSWQARVAFGNGAKGTLHSFDGRLRFASDNEETSWLYLLADKRVYRFSDGETYGFVDPDWRYPWLLPEEVLRELNVSADFLQTEEILGEMGRCYALNGISQAFAGVEGEDLTLTGEVCVTDDGIPVRMALSGDHDLEGQDDLVAWTFSLVLTEIARIDQADTLFQLPSDVEWIAPG